MVGLKQHKVGMALRLIEELLDHLALLENQEIFGITTMTEIQVAHLEKAATLNMALEELVGALTDTPLQLLEQAMGLEAVVVDKEALLGHQILFFMLLQDDLE